MCLRLQDALLSSYLIPSSSMIPYSPHAMSISVSSRFFITFIFSTIILPYTGVASQHCKNFDCGKFQNLGYPFGRIGSYCGDPDFQLLDCDGEGGPYLRFNYRDQDGLSFALKELYPFEPFEEDGTIRFEIALNATTDDCHSPLLQLKSGYFTYGSTYNFSVQRNGTMQYFFCDNASSAQACGFHWFPTLQHDKAQCEDSGVHTVTFPEAKLKSPISDELIKSVGFLVEAKIHPRRAEACSNCLYRSPSYFCGYDSTYYFQCFQQSQLQPPKPKKTGFEIVWHVLEKGALILVGLLILSSLLTLLCKRIPSGLLTLCKRIPSGLLILCKRIPSGLLTLCKRILSGLLILCKRILCKFKRSRKHDINNDMHTMEASLGTLPIFTHTELSQATNSFNADNRLGKGGFATVYQGKLRDGRDVAVKKLSQDITEGWQDFMKEALAYKNLNHPRIVRLYGCSSPAKAPLMLVFELVHNGTLAHHLHGDGRHNLTWNVRLKIAIQIAEALAFLHNSCPQILHRDVKSANILLDENFDAKVADFGISRLMPMDATHATTHPCGTPGYIDPEYFESFELTEKSDVYSYGVVLMEIVSSKRPVDYFRETDERNLAVMAKSKMAESSLHELIDGDVLREAENDRNVKDMVYGVAELACKCLASKKNERPTMREVASDLMEIKHDEANVHSRPLIKKARR